MADVYPTIETMTDGELVAALRDPNWRIRHLYYIMDKHGKRVLFAPWPEQEKFLASLWYRNLVVKARQRGFSTVFQLAAFDACLFTPDIRAAVIAHEKEAATKIFRDKIKYAYDNLPDLIKQLTPLRTASATEIVFENNSAFQVSTSARSGTFQWMHISEFGKMCAKYPLKAREVVTGSLPAVAPTGVLCIESTAEGREGPFFDMAQMSMDTDKSGRNLTRLDYRFHFASWWDADEYEIDPEGVIISPKYVAYFMGLEASLGIRISLAKRAWYVQTCLSDFGGDQSMMKQEYPSTPDEAFEVSIDGVILANQLTAARATGRITTVPYDPRVPVNTFWDLGINDLMVIWCHQRIGLRDHFIACNAWEGEPYATPVAWLNSLGYVVWGKHYLPHDGKQRNKGQFEVQQSSEMLAKLGLQNVEIVDRILNIVDGYQLLRTDFHSYWFDETACAEGLAKLADYRKVFNDRTQTYSSQPLHNVASNWADALRQKAQAFQPPSDAKRRRKRISGMAA